MEGLNLLSVHLQARLPADGGSGADPLELEAALQQLQVTHTEPTGGGGGTLSKGSTDHLCLLHLV